MSHFNNVLETAGILELYHNLHWTRASFNTNSSTARIPSMCQYEIPLETEDE